ncbi:MAG: hypothetical protein VKO21_02970 [Candidatus Sericytochromatia bacterium]|nr:hypothetical protein [Candidatus Sericytochromatia bacterium]
MQSSKSAAPLAEPLHAPPDASDIGTLYETLKPGDLVFFGSRAPWWPWEILRQVCGPWQHVALVLPDGLLLDAFWPEGGGLLTPEEAINRSRSRILADRVAVCRPWPDGPWHAISEELRALAGRPYNLLAAEPPEKMATAASCARAVMEAVRLVEPRHLPRTRWRYWACPIPGDLFAEPIGTWTLEPPVYPRTFSPTALLPWRLTAHALDVLTRPALSLVPALSPSLGLLLTRLFMNAMDVMAARTNHTLWPTRTEP